MMKYRLVLSVTILAFALSACGGEDSTTDNGDPSENTTNQTDSDAGTDADPDEPDATTDDPDTNTEEPDADPDTDLPDADTDPDPAVECEVDTNFWGQIGDTGEQWSGGVATEDAIADSAGIQAIYDAIETEGTDAPITFNPPLEIDGATIIGTGPADYGSIRNIWLQDADQAIYFHRLGGDNGEDGVPEQTYVGQKVSFKVDMVDFFDDMPQIREFSEWTAADGTDNPVPYAEIGSGDLTMDEHYLQNVRVGGRIATAGVGCGGTSNCYDLVYGENEEKTATFRVKDDFVLSIDDCVTFVGPTSAFPGPYSDDPAGIQVDAKNFSWVESN